MSRSFKVQDLVLSRDSEDFFVVAELGSNHQGDVGIARRLIDEAAAAGVQAVKLQKRSVRTLYTREMYDYPYDHEDSFGSTYGLHRETLELDEHEYRQLIEHARKKGVVVFATAFDLESVEFLERLEMPAYKIGSADLTTYPLLEAVGKTGKPVFLSTGAASLTDIREAYQFLRKFTEDICLMQCTSIYPADPADLNLRVIPTYLRQFPDAVIGYSGHDNGIVMPVAAYLLGARVIEKHFTLNRAMKGTDHKFSLEPVGLRKMIRDLNRVKVALGTGEKVCLPQEIPARDKLGKSLVLRAPVKANAIIQADMLTFKAPGGGIPPNKISVICGRKLKMDLDEDTVLRWEHLL